MISEIGGIGWDVEGGWGYGGAPKSMEEFYARYQGTLDALLDNPNLFGFCYTQLTDVRTGAQRALLLQPQAEVRRPAPAGDHLPRRRV